MRYLIAILASAAAVMAADGQAATKKTAPAPSKAASKKAPAKVNDASKPLAIPEGAVADATGDYHYTDPGGKKWIYRKTPFGVSRLEDTPENAAPKAEAASGAGIVAFDQGDTVRFERKGPFGMWKWEKKKSELDESEKAALQNSLTSRQNASKQ